MIGRRGEPTISRGIQRFWTSVALRSFSVHENCECPAEKRTDTLSSPFKRSSSTPFEKYGRKLLDVQKR
ncbi:hypothetical protein RB195_000196 [Necator americanus]